MNDLIYRQSAINALENTECELLAEEWNELTNAIKQVPSAEQDNDMIHLQKEQAYLQGWEEGREALKQSAIDAVEKESQVDGAYGYMDTKSIVDLLSDLPSAQQWTPISEGEPKENGKYLVSVEKSEWDGTTRRSVRTMTYNKREVAPFRWGHYEIYSGKVTAWMPLPEPYRGDADE